MFACKLRHVKGWNKEGREKWHAQEGVQRKGGQGEVLCTRRLQRKGVQTMSVQTKGVQRRGSQKKGVQRKDVQRKDVQRKGV